MYDKQLIHHLIQQIEEALNRIERRFEGISSPEDFIDTDEGLDRLDGIAMMLIAVGESVKNIDKISHGAILSEYPGIHWPGVKGVRDIIAHDYFNIDPDEIFAICSTDITPLKEVLVKIRREHL